MPMFSLRVLIFPLLSMLIISANSIFGQVTVGLPDDFPEIQLNVLDNPEPGYIFITPCGLWGSFPDATPYLAILDNYGTPVFYEELTRPAFDFKLQPNGYLSFHDGGYGFRNHIMDSAFEVIENHKIIGFSGTDFHDFKILDNGNYLLLGWEDRLVDMDTVIPGGQQGVTVRGTLIQEQDDAGLVLWQWSSWDHFKILETDTSHVNLYSSNLIDYVHTNAVFQDSDTSILISSRNMHEITKINKNTGELMWRMGGSQNEFSFVGDDTLGFSGQHDISRLENGNYLLFDNGWFHPDNVSSALELQLDEVNKTASVVSRYRSQPDDISGYIMGSSQRLPGGNTLVGWGSGVPNVTEFKPDGTKALEFEFESVSYRAFKYPWKTNIMSFNSEIIDYGEIYYTDSVYESITTTNNLDEDIIISWMHGRTGKYYCITELPLLIEAGSSEEIIIQFKPEEIGSFDDILTIYAERADQSIIKSFALQIEVYGWASIDASIPAFSVEEVSIYPNPTKGLINIRRSNISGELNYKITNIQGQLIQDGLIPAGTSFTTVDVREENAGLYIVHLHNETSGINGYYKIIKQE
jgi:hypothetical protein